MLNIEVNRSAEGVERYFDRELAVSDYLMKEPGVWAGRGAERLGLRGPVEPTATPQPTSLVGRQLASGVQMLSFLCSTKPFACQS
jgi:hypothetical protein